MRATQEQFDSRISEMRQRLNQTASDRNRIHDMTKWMKANWDSLSETDKVGALERYERLFEKGASISTS